MDLGLWCLTSPSAIYQLCPGDQFYYVRICNVGVKNEKRKLKNKTIKIVPNLSVDTRVIRYT